MFKGDLILPARLRKYLGKAYGRIISEGELAGLFRGTGSVYAVGDVVVGALLRNGFTPSVSVYDFKVGRKRRFEGIIARRFKRPLRAVNRRGGISRELWKAVKASLKARRPIGIRVYGEEDMAAVAFAYLAQEGSVLIYGLPGRGMHMVRINSRIKLLAEGILSQMKSV